MNTIDRRLLNTVFNKLIPNKVIVILGARRVGKTQLLHQVMNKLTEDYLLFNGEDVAVHELFARRSVENYKQVLGKHKVLIIDEAQKIPDIGNILKLIVDNIEEIRIIVTGSSAFDVRNITGEPLTGRKFTLRMFPVAESEYREIESLSERKDKMFERLVYGNYPELLHLSNQKDKQEYLTETMSSYLLKDILVFENLRNSDKIVKLLRLIAFQLGKEVSNQELGQQLSISKNTVEKYLDLLQKVFIIHKLGGFSRNLRKEVSKNPRWYFSDNGIRNAVIGNFNPVALREDIGLLWENYIISERLKFQEYERQPSNNYFWRTYDKQEIDWIEEREGKLFAYEMKWNKEFSKIPVAWKNAYPDSEFQVISQHNYLSWLTGI